MRNQINLGRWRVVNLVQHLPTPLGHDHEPGRTRDQFLHHPALVGGRLLQHRVQRRDDRHFQFPQHGQHVAAGRPAKNPELVLHADDVHIADIQEVRRALIRRQVLFLNLEAHRRRVFVTTLNVIDRHRETLALGMFRCHGREQVGGERGDAAFARQVIAEQRDLLNLSCGSHRFVHINLRPDYSIAVRAPHRKVIFRESMAGPSDRGARAWSEAAARRNPAPF